MSKQEEIRGYLQSFIEGVMTDVNRAKGLSKGMFDWGAYLVLKEAELAENLVEKCSNPLRYKDRALLEAWSGCFQNDMGR